MHAMTNRGSAEPWPDPGGWLGDAAPGAEGAKSG